MATQNHTIAGSGYGNVFIDSLVWGSAGWTVGAPTTARRSPPPISPRTTVARATTA